MSKGIALYYRVSTDDQSIDPQRLELQDYCQRKGWSVAAEYCETISGAKFTRTGLDRLMAAVRKRKLDAILCVKLDRLGRSFPHLAQMIFEFDSNGVALICTSQPIDTSEESPAGRLIMHVLIAMAEFERSLIKERTLSGLRIGKARGVEFGRPVSSVTQKCREIVQSFREGNIRTYRELAKALDCSVSRAHALAKALTEIPTSPEKLCRPGVKRVKFRCGCAFRAGSGCQLTGALRRARGWEENVRVVTDLDELTPLMGAAKLRLCWL